MPVYNYGKRNHINYSPEDLPYIDIEVYGSDNIIDLEKFYMLHGHVKIVIYGNFCQVLLRKSIYIGKELSIKIGKNADFLINNTKVLIGSKTTIEGMEIVSLQGNNQVIVGQQCMISDNVLIYNSDGHPCYHENANVAYNKTKNLIVSDFVWLGKDTRVLKNSYIAKNCIVGMGSIVSGIFKKENCIIAGNPAKVVKRNICYRHSDSEWLQNSPLQYTPWTEIKHKNEKLLTVYVLTYNHEKTIARTLDSILEQKTRYNFDVVILEDCSTDNTLKICQSYQRKFPQKIKIVSQPVNTKAEHSRWAKEKIETKYWCTIEGDDYWCDCNKVEMALDVLEHDNTIIGFASDTKCINFSRNREYSLKHQDITRADTGKTYLINYSNFQYVHTSSIIYRHIIDFKKYKLPLIDTYLLYYHLSFGPIFYYDKIMSCHPQTGHGMWSSLSNRQRNFNNEYIHYDINKALNYRYDKVFSSTVRKRKLLAVYKFILGKSLGWKFYITWRFISLQIYKAGHWLS